MCNEKNIGIAIGLFFTVVATMMILAHAGLFPTCDYYGGFQRSGGATGSSCECLGMKYFTMDDAPHDGISHSVCFGIRTEIKN